MNDKFKKEQSARIRAMAEKADPFIKKRLLALAESYEKRASARHLPSAAIEGQKHTDHQSTSSDPS
jgi:hypothetical protein